MDTLRYASALHHTWSQTNRTHRYTAGQRLCETKDIRLQVIVVACEEASRTPKTRLHLINNQQCSSFAAQRCKTMHILLRSDMHSSFALHQFNDHSCCLLTDCCFSRRKVVVADVAYTRDEWRERFTVVRLPCCRKRAHRATM